MSTARACYLRVHTKTSSAESLNSALVLAVQMVKLQKKARIRKQRCCFVYVKVSQVIMPECSQKKQSFFS
jgi:hypothetical protein